jgi:PKD repeat protein
MTTLNKLYLLLAFLIFSVSLNAQVQDWAKLYGDGESQYPNRIKAYDDGLYVLGETIEMGQTFGTFTKFDPATGSVIWHFRMNRQSAFRDFAWDPVQDAFILVGRTLPYSNTIDNASLAVQVDDNGQALLEREWDFAGREGFWKVVYHPQAVDPSFPFFVLGRKNPETTAPNTYDEAVILNLDLSLTEKWRRTYLAGIFGAGGIELEAYRGLVPLNNGNLLILGNGSLANEGVVIGIDGTSGGPYAPNSLFNAGLYFPDFIDFYDGVQLPNGDIALVGERFQSHEGIILIIDKATNQTKAGLVFSDIRQFRELAFVDPLNANASYEFYVVGDLKGGPEEYNYVHKIIYNPTTSGIFLDYAHQLPATATDFGNPHITLSANGSRVYYADSRTDAAAATPTQEMFIGNLNVDFFVECTESFNSPNLPYSVVPTIVRLKASSTLASTDVTIADPLTTPLPFVCSNHCISPPPCSADFSFEVDCCEGVFSSNVSGTAPFTYFWDINCDGVSDGIGNVPNFNYTFPGSGVYQVCLTITDATGCSNTVQKSVTVVDNPPVLTCPDVVIPTDLGECFATYQPIIDAMDDCTPVLRPSCTFSGATSGSGTITSFDKGITTVDCAVEDNKGQLARCSFTITVEDREPPKVVCPAAPTPITVPGCEGGARVVWNDPIFTDNCPMVTISGTHLSEDFFGCGTTTVTYTATDMSGLTTSCSFPVTVNCECAEVASEEIHCGMEDNLYDFNFKVLDLTGANPSNCQVTVTSPQAGVSVQNISFSGGVVRGEISIPAAPIPTTIRLNVRVECFCPDGTSRVCTIPVFFTTPCCKEISIADQEQCRATDEVTIDLIGCNTLFDVRQVRYYVSDAPCTPGSPMTLIQVSQDCRPLKLAPQYHNGDICVYAEVDMGPGAGPCRQLRTDTALVKLCAPVSCTLTDEAFCYAGTPITPTLLSLSINDPDTCAYSIQWYDANGAISGATGSTYQPPALSMTAGSTACNESFTYRAEITSICGVQSCSATIQLDNNDAPIGEIILHAPDTNPLCYGEDAVLEYVRNCEQPGDRWTWEQRTTSTPFSDITTNGNQNPLYQTNRLYEDHWYRIAEQNGLCPVDTVSYFLDIIDPLVITSFTAVHGPTCAPTQIDMALDWGPLQTGCTYKVVWYHDGNPVFSETVAGGPRTFSYVPPVGMPLSGNFYAEVSTSCCEEDVKSPVVSLDPPMEVLIASPCFRCNADTVTLNGIVLNVPAGVTCTYQWYDNGTALTGETGVDLIVDPWWIGPFTFEVTCSDGCVRTATIDLLQCGTYVSANNIELLKSEAYPNPTSGILYIELEKPARFAQLEVLSISGQVMKTLPGSGTASRHEVDLSNLPAGIYLVRGIAETGELLVVKAIKE